MSVVILNLGEAANKSDLTNRNVILSLTVGERALDCGTQKLDITEVVNHAGFVAGTTNVPRDLFFEADAISSQTVRQCSIAEVGRSNRPMKLPYA